MSPKPKSETIMMVKLGVRRVLLLVRGSLGPLSRRVERLEDDCVGRDLRRAFGGRRRSVVGLIGEVLNSLWGHSFRPPWYSFWSDRSG